MYLDNGTAIWFLAQHRKISLYPGASRRCNVQRQRKWRHSFFKMLTCLFPIGVQIKVGSRCNRLVAHLHILDMPHAKSAKSLAALAKGHQVPHTGADMRQRYPLVDEAIGLNTQPARVSIHLQAWIEDIELVGTP